MSVMTYAVAGFITRSKCGREPGKSIGLPLASSTEVTKTGSKRIPEVANTP